MINDNVRAVEILMDSINRGIVYVDTDKRIQMCNSKAKEITGIVIDTAASHEAGSLSEGDIVILADNRLGQDDGHLTADELAMLNINDRDIREGDMLLAIGVYKNKKIEPEYKYLRQPLNVPMGMDVNYLGFHIAASIDAIKKETLIVVNGDKFVMPYYSAVGNIVVVDGFTGKIKFFQAKGYSVRNEDAGNILRGQPYKGKLPDDADVDIIGKKFLELFDQSELSERLFQVLEGRESAVRNKLYEINKRPFICNLIGWKSETSPELTEGAFLIIQSAEDLESLLSDRNEIIRQIEADDPDKSAGEGQYPDGAFENFAGNSRKTKEVKYMAYKASLNKFNVIITGESGTGKSKLAREIHRMGNPSAPFVEVNCNAIAPSLFESELFGYVGGAFTGARNDGKVGFFEAANGGTVFLDEIGEIPLDIQVKLLHVLQNKIIYRVGSSRPVKVDVRVIAATNKNLEEEVAKGNFRQDLFYRVNVFPIEIPPIRERKADLYFLINQILKQSCENYGIEQKQFSGDALRKLTSYNWPGNVRELENAIERAITLCSSNIIYAEHLKIGSGGTPLTMKEILAREEERIIDMTLLKHNGDKQKAMDELNMSRTVFYDKLKRYGIKY